MTIRGILEAFAELGCEIKVSGAKLRLVFKGERPPMTKVRPLLEVLRTRKPEVLAYLKEGDARADREPCTTCPWCRDNPWTHDPELPLWCGWWWDHLAGDSGQCRDRREGRVPDPESGDPRIGPLTLARFRETTATCFDCAHFRPAEGSPNPTQAWGQCTRTGGGRYGVSRACDGFKRKSTA